MGYWVRRLRTWQDLGSFLKMLVPILMQCRARLPSRAVRMLWTFPPVRAVPIIWRRYLRHDLLQGRPHGTSGGPKPGSTLLTEAADVFNVCLVSLALPWTGCVALCPSPSSRVQR